MQNDVDQTWIAAYSVAMGMLVLGATINQQTIGTGTAETLDQSARVVADRVVKTVEERAALAKAKGKGKSQ